MTNLRLFACVGVHGADECEEEVMPADLEGLARAMFLLTVGFGNKTRSHSGILKRPWFNRQAVRSV